ncbi:MAG: DUF6377 domain-containing protein [Paludibacter sp.]|nr:DUF6377 domain-containing protein [Paludibacter sp.]
MKSINRITFKLKLIVLVLFANVSVFANESMDSLIQRIDQAIKESDQYTSLREQRIAHLKENKQLVKRNTVDEYKINNQLFDEYKQYICDSALHYESLNLAIAEQLNDLSRNYESKIKLALLMGTTGMYKESIDLLETIDESKLPEFLQVNYLYTNLRVYNELAFYTQDKHSSENYWRIGGEYMDKLRKVIYRDSSLELQLREDSARNMHNFGLALKLNDIWLSRIPKGSPDYALATFHRSLMYQWQGMVEEQKHYLALSAISDIESAIKDQASLRMLAQILFEEGDIDRAYNYIRFSWNATVFYNAKLRSLQTATILSMIDKTYQAKIENQKSQLQKYLLLISSLFVLLIVALLVIFQQFKKLSAAKVKLQNANSELNDLNTALSKLNAELTELNRMQNITNVELSESNKIKEVYIGRFLELCSVYIVKIDDFRKKVHSKIRDGKVREVQSLTQSPDLMDEEFEELYDNFDNAFLELFPDFVEKVNELLNEEDRFVLKKGELLTPELRIIALMRLGINDGTKISHFLRYSLTTVYNYRTKIKNRTFLNKDVFDSKILEIR